jgi:hypothetical protein
MKKIKKKNALWWSKQEARLAVRLWRAGKTSREIAKALPGRTRNAVMGYLNRHNLLKTKRKSSPEERRRRKQQRERAYRTRAALKIAAKRAVQRAAKQKFLRDGNRTPPTQIRLPDCVVAKSILEVALGECRFMPGNSKLCCAKPTGDIMRSWCPEHQKVVYN